MMLSLLPLIAFSLHSIFARLKKTYLLIIFLIFFFAMVIKKVFLIFTDFSKAYIPVSDIMQYQSDWPSGGGVRESIELLKKEAEKGKIYVATQGTFGLMPFALEIYLVQNPNITIEGIWPIDDAIPAKVLEMSRQMPTYFVFYQPCPQCSFAGGAPRSWESLELVYKFKKEHGGRYLSLYRVMP